MNKIAKLFISHYSDEKTEESCKIIDKIAKQIKEAGFKGPITLTKVSGETPIFYKETPEEVFDFLNIDVSSLDEPGADLYSLIDSRVRQMTDSKMKALSDEPDPQVRTWNLLSFITQLNIAAEVALKFVKQKELDNTIGENVIGQELVGV